MKRLEADIKKGIFKNIYLLHGPQSYLRKYYVSVLTGHFLNSGDTINYSYFYGAKTDLGEAASMAGTMPFLSEHRVVVLEDTGLFSKSCEELAELIETLPETTVLIFSEEKIDRQLRQTKATISAGCAAEFKDLPPEELKKWVMAKLSREHRAITASALDMFLARCPDDMWQISGELEKLISYTFGKDGIRDADVDAVCPPPAEDKIFNMIDAMLDGNVEKALNFYKDLLILGREPIGLIRQQLRLMLHILDMNGQSGSYKDMADILGVSPGRVKMALLCAGKRSKIYYTEGLKKCADTEERIKSSRVDETVGVETLIVELCR